MGNAPIIYCVLFNVLPREKSAGGQFNLSREELDDVEKELIENDQLNKWDYLYERLRNESTLKTKSSSIATAREVVNRSKNRYRDISPCTVKLQRLRNSDYINASYVSVSCVPQRRYILTQGPLPRTAGHFWLMVWEQCSPSIIMLNRIYEKGTMKCFPYFPCGRGPTTTTFADVGLSVQLNQEKFLDVCIFRVFELKLVQT
ncbi:unnamed protein product [Protopolystoma xenopodis]|uniref:protein-tyrosine-phosphatase n=1 Tax=Protopolystoma xenopodis TaxID=117903 RepID=A0A448X369_9PLAT|nr:unnamed protein product [Protopolystoma xenopodis]